MSLSIGTAVKTHTLTTDQTIRIHFHIKSKGHRSFVNTRAEIKS